MQQSNGREIQKVLGELQAFQIAGDPELAATLSPRARAAYATISELAGKGGEVSARECFAARRSASFYADEIRQKIFYEHRKLFRQGSVLDKYGDSPVLGAWDSALLSADTMAASRIDARFADSRKESWEVSETRRVRGDIVREFMRALVDYEVLSPTERVNWPIVGRIGQGRKVFDLLNKSGELNKLSWAIMRKVQIEAAVPVYREYLKDRKEFEGQYGSYPLQGAYASQTAAMKSWEQIHKLLLITRHNGSENLGGDFHRYYRKGGAKPSFVLLGVNGMEQFPYPSPLRIVIRPSGSQVGIARRVADILESVGINPNIARDFNCSLGSMAFCIFPRAGEADSGPIGKPQHLLESTDTAPSE